MKFQLSEEYSGGKIHVIIKSHHLRWKKGQSQPN